MANELASTKVQEICELLRKETLDPAKKDAERLLSDAKKEAEVIIKQAQVKAQEIEENSAKELFKKQNVHEASIQLALKQGISKLKQLVAGIFSDELQSMVSSKMKDNDLIAKILDAMVSGVQKDGLKTDLVAVLGAAASKDQVLNKLSSEVKERLGKGGMRLGHFVGGCELHLVDDKLAIPMTDEIIKEILAQYCDKELKEMLQQL